MATKKSGQQYLKHQHKIILLLGLLIFTFSYQSRQDFVIAFAAIIIGVAIANIKALH